jgi:hypothetical protein
MFLIFHIIYIIIIACFAGITILAIVMLYELLTFINDFVGGFIDTFLNRR